MLSTLLVISIALLTLIAAVGAGSRVLHILGFKFAFASESLALSLGTGLALLVVTMVALAAVHGLYPVAAWILVVSLLAAGFSPMWTKIRSIRYGDFQWVLSLPFVFKIFLVLGLVYSLAYLGTGLLPPLDGDSLYGYLLLPREYARQHSLVVVDYAYGYYYPQNAQLLTTLGFLLQGENLAMTLVSYAMGCSAALVAYSMGRAYFGRVAGVAAALVFYTMLAVGSLNGSAKVDLAWVFFDLLGVFAFTRWYFGEKAQIRWLVLSGVFLGLAIGIKYTTLYTVFALGLALLADSLFTREARSLRVVGVRVLAMGAPFAIGSLWLIRTYLLTGNPVYPMLNSIILGDRGGQIGFNEFRGVLGFPAILWSISMDYIARGMGRPVGPALIATIPLLLVFRQVDRRVILLLLFGAVTAVLWYFGVQRPRHFLTTLAVLSVVSGYAVATLFNYSQRLGITLVALVIAAAALNFVIWARHAVVVPDIVTYPTGLTSRDQFLRDRIGQSLWYPDYDILQYINNELPAGARLVGVPSSGAAYYIDRPTYGRLLPLTTGDAETLCDLRTHGITHMWVNFDLMSYLTGANTGIVTLTYWPQDSRFRSTYLTELYPNPSQAIYRIEYPASLDCSSFPARRWYP